MFSMPLIFPDPVELGIDYLADEMSVPVVHQIPSPRPAEFVRVLAGGGTQAENRPVDMPMLIIEAWAATASRSSELARVARASLSTAPGDVTGVVRVDSTSPVDLPDPESTQQRHTFNAVVHVRGEQPTPGSS